MTDKPRLTKIDNNTWQYDGALAGDGRIRMERSMSGRREVLLRFYEDQQPNARQDGSVWIKQEDLGGFVAALRALARPTCSHCMGSGVEA